MNGPSQAAGTETAARGVPHAVVATIETRWGPAPGKGTETLVVPPATVWTSCPSTEISIAP